MSNERWMGHVSGRVAMDPQLSTTAKAAYLVLAVHADRDGYCWPSHTTIAVALGKSRSTALRAMQELVDAKVVKKDARYYPVTGRQQSNGYTLLDVKVER